MSWIRQRRCWAALILMLPHVGCSSLQDAHYEHTQKLRTEMAYLHYWWCHTGGGGTDYRRGWKAGYRDVTMGGDGQPPLVAPHAYWKPSQILKDCDQRRQEWYLGFQDGAMMASLEPDTHYIKLWTPPPAVVYQASAVMPESADGAPLVPAGEQPALTPTPANAVEDIPMPDLKKAPKATNAPSPPTKPPVAPVPEKADSIP